MDYQLSYHSLWSLTCAADCRWDRDWSYFCAGDPAFQPGKYIRSGILRSSTLEWLHRAFFFITAFIKEKKMQTAKFLDQLSSDQTHYVKWNQCDVCVCVGAKMSKVHFHIKFICVFSSVPLLELLNLLKINKINFKCNIATIKVGTYIFFNYSSLDKFCR